MDKQDKIRTWRDLHFGMFIHYGLYSLPGGVWKGEPVSSGYSEQILSHGNVDPREYEALTAEFRAESFDADAIARLAAEGGMGYIVLTTKHHDGFCLFDTKTTDYNSAKAAAGRDLVKEMSEACARRGLKFGLYYSWIDWHCPGALPFSDHNSDTIPDAHQEMNRIQLRELLTNYGPICEMWFDMGSPSPHQSRELADLVRELQPEAMINGRIWNGQDDFIVLADNEIPGFSMDRPWQTPASIYHETWGYRSWQKREDLEGKIREQIRNLATISALGGNHLLNIGPMGDGSVLPFEAQVIRGIGAWLEQHREAIFGADPGFWETEDWGFSTKKDKRLYLQLHNIPEDRHITLKGLRSRALGAELMGGGKVPMAERKDGLVLGPVPEAADSPLPVIRLEFGEEPRLDAGIVISEGKDYSPDGESARLYQGREYYSYKPVVASRSWTLRPDADGRLTIDLPCRKGETVKIVISSEKEVDGLIRPLDGDSNPLIRLEEN